MYCGEKSQTFIYTYCHRLLHLIKLLLCTADCLDFLGSRRHRPHWLHFKGPNFRRGVLLISPGANEGHFEGKRPRKDHQVCLVLARQYPNSPVTCNPEDSSLLGILASWSHILFSGSGPLGLPFVLWIKKTIETSPFFVRCGGHCCRGDLVGRTTYLNFFLSGLRKLQQRAKKSVELRGKYVE